MTKTVDGLTKSQRYYKKNKAKCLETNKKWAQANKLKLLEIKRKYRKNNKEKTRAYARKYESRPENIDRAFRLTLRKYGMTAYEWAWMYHSEHGLCKICKSWMNIWEPRSAVIDHCHNTGAVRGLICDNCNKGIGFLKDSPEIIKSALEYLTGRNDDQDF